ncbi:hypothetical protein SAMN05443635_10178 [Roseobacter denitrificans OCh 114]|nr:hypothetical protein SAMN05443635_10178 [Roseobacter denitrificans OCh 114]
MTGNEISVRVAALEELERQIKSSIDLLAEIDRSLSLLNGTERPVQTPFETPLKPVANAAQHLREHRPGRPSKIDNDPELRAFIVARINTTTFTALEREVAEAFPPDRRIGKSAIHNWWERNLKSIPKSDPE